MEVQNDSINEQIEKLCNTAISYAKSFDKKFDFSEKSISNLDDILQYYFEDIPKSRSTENEIFSMALIFGAYLGETMRRNKLAEKGFEWQRKEGGYPYLQKIGQQSAVFPVNKVYKRIVNGIEDSVSSFYAVTLHFDRL